MVVISSSIDEGPFPGARYVDPLLLLGWYGRQKEVDELRAEVESFGDERTVLLARIRELRAEVERLRASLEPIQAERDELRSEVTTLEWSLSEATKAAERFQAALKVHHDLGLWSPGHEICPECRQTCR
jgi:DNA repair exonuclease SbcCD ATPase subunit